MNNFGKLKEKILKKLTESYSKDDKPEVKKILKLIKENKDFRSLYLFYDGIEELNIPDSMSAELYIESVSNILIEKMSLVKPICKKINEMVSDVEVGENRLYESLDIISEKSNLQNIDKQIKSKKFLIDHLTKDKKSVVKESSIYSENESLLIAVLSNNFNALYDNTLNESEKVELKSILSMSNGDLLDKTTELRESILSSVNLLLKESTDTNLNNKLKTVSDEVSNMDVNKYNYYKMLQLKNGFI